MKSTASPDSSNDPTKIDAFRHQDQRTNIPSDEHAPFVATDGAEHIMSTPPRNGTRNLIRNLCGEERTALTTIR